MSNGAARVWVFNFLISFVLVLHAFSPARFDLCLLTPFDCLFESAPISDSKPLFLHSTSLQPFKSAYTIPKHQTHHFIPSAHYSLVTNMDPTYTSLIKNRHVHKTCRERDQPVNSDNLTGENPRLSTGSLGHRPFEFCVEGGLPE